jgi:hypothetical protein
VSLCVCDRHARVFNKEEKQNYKVLFRVQIVNQEI